ncbi:MAG: AEC family transporter [Phycisphaerae bacterium]|nr:AEC family transporter [Phycisphaerae bacterium]
MYILNVLTPVFLVIALGAVLRRAKFVSDETLGGMSRLAYWVGLPCVLLLKVSKVSFDGGTSLDTFWLVLIGMLASLLAGAAVVLALRLPSRQVGAFIQACFRGNLAFVGLPVVVSAFTVLPDAPGDALARAEQMIAFTLGPIVPCYNIAAVLVLLACRHRLGARAVRTMIVQVVTNPLLVSCVAGVVLSLLGTWLDWYLPNPIVRTLNTVGQFALPVALLCVGGKIAATKIGGHVRLPALAAVVKLTVGPVVGYFVAGWLGAGHVETAVALIMLACPTAVASYVLTEQLGGDASLSAGAVVVSTVLSVVALGVVVTLI